MLRMIKLSLKEEKGLRDKVTFWTKIESKCHSKQWVIWIHVHVLGEKKIRKGSDLVFHACHNNWHCHCIVIYSICNTWV